MRYQRQTLISEVGKEGQASLSQARVLIVGMGGLGTPAALYLAGAGVGTLGLIDSDEVNVSNLHRQILYRMEDIGTSKVIAAKKRLNAMNPEVQIVTHAEDFAAINALSIASQYDLMVDGSDRFATKFLINDISLKLGIPWIYASAAQWDGQIALFDPRVKQSACYRCFRPEMPKVQIQNCAESGVIGPVVGMIGVEEALLAMQVLLPSVNPEASVLTTFDGLSRTWMNLKIQKNPKCKSCAGAQSQIAIRDEAEWNCEIPNVQSINALELKNDLPEILKTHLVLDVRELDEWNEGHIEGATHWPLSLLQKKDFPEVRREQKILVYCQSGKRSTKAAEILKNSEFLSICELAGGINAWNKLSNDSQVKLL